MLKAQKAESGGRELCVLLDKLLVLNSVLGQAGEEQAWIMDGASAELKVLLDSSKEH